MSKCKYEVGLNGGEVKTVYADGFELNYNSDLSVYIEEEDSRRTIMYCPERNYEYILNVTLNKED